MALAQSAKNPGKIPARIVPSPTRTYRDFGRREFRFPPRILARFSLGTRRDFGRREFRFLPRIPARFWPPGFPFPAGNPGGHPGGKRNSRRPKSRRNLAGILPRSCHDPGAIFTGGFHKSWKEEHFHGWMQKFPTIGTCTSHESGESQK